MSAISAVSPFAAASAGLLRASQSFGAAAQATATDPTGDSSVQNIVSQTEAKTSFSANLKTLQVADQMTRALLDIKV